MTKNQIAQFNRMRAALIRIHKHYQTPAQLYKNGEKQYGPSYEECLEMAYENLQYEAKRAVSGVKEMKPPAAKPKIQSTP